MAGASAQESRSLFLSVGRGEPPGAQIRRRTSRARTAGRGVWCRKSTSGLSIFELGRRLSRPSPRSRARTIAQRRLRHTWKRQATIPPTARPRSGVQWRDESRRADAPRRRALLRQVRGLALAARMRPHPPNCRERSRPVTKALPEVSERGDACDGVVEGQAEALGHATEDRRPLDGVRSRSGAASPRGRSVLRQVWGLAGAA